MDAEPNKYTGGRVIVDIYQKQIDLSIKDDARQSTWGVYVLGTLHQSKVKTKSIASQKTNKGWTVTLYLAESFLSSHTRSQLWL